MPGDAYATAVADLFRTHGREPAAAATRARRDAERVRQAFAVAAPLWGEGTTAIPPLARAAAVDSLRRCSPTSTGDPALHRLSRLLPPFGLHHAHRWRGQTPEPALALLPPFRHLLEESAGDRPGDADVDEDVALLGRVLQPWSWSAWLDPDDDQGEGIPRARYRAATYAWASTLDLAAQREVQRFVATLADATGEAAHATLRRWGRLGTLLLLSSWAADADTSTLTAEQASRDLGGPNDHDLPGAPVDAYGWALLRLYKFRTPAELRAVAATVGGDHVVGTAAAQLVHWGARRARRWGVTDAGTDERIARALLVRAPLRLDDTLWPDQVYDAGILARPDSDARPRGRPGRHPRPERPAPPAPQPPSRVERVLDQIDALVGLERVKRQVRRMVALVQVERRRQALGLPVPPTTLHLVFTGNPGTGKTTVARLYGELLRELGVLERGHFIEATRDDFVARYLGQTTEKTNRLCRRAYGGVLFVDEAYALAQGRDWDYGREAIDALVKQMEDNRDKLVVIVAGYPAPMGEFLDLNPGLRGRFPLTIPFDDFTDAELAEVFDLLMAEGHFRVDPDARAAAVAAMAAMPRTSHFANARAVRNLIDEIRMRQAERLAAEGDADLDRIVRSDVPFRDRRPSLSRKRARVAAALDRLEAMPGLAPVKHHVRSLVDLAEVEAARRAKGRPPVAPPGHLALVGNPGTGKTTVARLVADLYGGLGLLSSGHVLEVGRKDLVHGFGGSAARVGAAAAAARGGVLLIDEAYALSLGQADLPGQEAVDALVDVMENQRDDLVVILTGYRHRIDELLESNPGLRSRVSEVLDFPDYDGETCAQIFHRFVADARLSYAEGAQSMVELAMMLLPFEPDFANARSVREAFEATVRRQAARLVAQRAEAGGRPGEGWSGIEGGSQVLTVLTADDIAGG